MHKFNKTCYFIYIYVDIFFNYILSCFVFRGYGAPGFRGSGVPGFWGPGVPSLRRSGEFRGSGVLRFPELRDFGFLGFWGSVAPGPLCSGVPGLPLGFRRSGGPGLRCSGAPGPRVPGFRGSVIPGLLGSAISRLRCSNALEFRGFGPPGFRGPGASVLRCSNVTRLRGSGAGSGCPGSRAFGLPACVIQGLQSPGVPKPRWSDGSGMRAPGGGGASGFRGSRGSDGSGRVLIRHSRVITCDFQPLARSRVISREISRETK